MNNQIDQVKGKTISRVQHHKLNQEPNDFGLTLHFTDGTHIDILSDSYQNESEAYLTYVPHPVIPKEGHPSYTGTSGQGK